MIDINYYRKIQNAYGATSLRDAKTQQIKMDLNNDFDKPLDCFTVLVDGVAKDLTIIETNNLDEKKIKARPNTTFKSGQVVEWMDWYWLITKVNRRNDIVTNGEIWTITPNDYVTTSQNGNSLLVKCDDEDLDGETITISVKDNYSGFTTSVEVTLSVF